VGAELSGLKPGGVGAVWEVALCSREEEMKSSREGDSYWKLLNETYGL